MGASVKNFDFHPGPIPVCGQRIFFQSEGGFGLGEAWNFRAERRDNTVTSVPPSCIRVARSSAEAPLPMTATLRPRSFDGSLCAALWLRYSAGRCANTSGVY